MARRTLAFAIRKNKSEYYRLMAFEARENERIHHMKKRIKLLAEDEKNSLALQVYLTDLLAQVQQQKTELEQAIPSKERNKTLKKVEKEYKEIDKKHKRNEYHLAVIEIKKEKDNVARLILKEAKRDEIRVRAQAAYQAWRYFEHIQQQQEADFDVVLVQQQCAYKVTNTHTVTIGVEIPGKTTVPQLVDISLFRTNLVVHDENVSHSIHPHCWNLVNKMKRKRPVRTCQGGSLIEC